MDVAFCTILYVEYYVQNEQKPCAVVIVKRTAGCTENQGGHGQANRQQRSGNTKCEFVKFNPLSKFSAVCMVILISIL